jgi:hypothetical protein
MIRPRGIITYASDLIEIKTRIPSPLRDRLRERADADRRSVNAEIIVLLEQALSDDGARRQAADELIKLSEELGLYGSGWKPAPAAAAVAGGDEPAAS